MDDANVPADRPTDERSRDASPADSRSHEDPPAAGPRATDARVPDDASATDVTRPTASRRRVLAATGTAAVAGVASLAPTVAAQETTTQEPTEIRLLGAVSGWTGQAPARIEGEENPTLYLEAGTEYRFVWENGDGASHDLRLRDAEGTTVARTETMGEQGATRSLTVTATEELAEYRCGIHPFSMTGEVSFEEPPTDTPTATETDPVTTTATDTPTATETGPLTTTRPATATDARTTGVGEGGGSDGDGEGGGSDGGGLPGFGALAALAGLASALGLARRRRD